MGLKPSALSTTGSGWCRPTSCASSSLTARVRCRLGTSSEIAIRHVVLHQPSSHGPGAGWLSPPDASRLESLRSCETQDPLTGALPQPDPPGHLMSRDRGAPGGEPAACGRRPRRAGAVDLRRSRRAALLSRLRSRVNDRASGSRGPATRLRKPAVAEGRFTRTSAKRPEIGCTRGAFHRWATRTREPGLSSGFACQVGPYPQVVTNLWRTLGAVPSLAASMLRSGCLDGRPAAWTWSLLRLGQAEARSVTQGS